MAISQGLHSTGCGIGTLQGVSVQDPEIILKGLFKKESRYVGGGKYETVSYFGGGYRWIHVFFSDYTKDHYAETYLKHAKKKEDIAKALPKGSGEKLMAYIRENSLGTVVRSPAMFNPAHPERDGKDPVYGYIWTLDNEDGIKAWAKKHHLL